MTALKVGRFNQITKTEAMNPPVPEVSDRLCGSLRLDLQHTGCGRVEFSENLDAERSILIFGEVCKQSSGGLLLCASHAVVRIDENVSIDELNAHRVLRGSR